MGGGRDGSRGINFSSCSSMISGLNRPGRSTFTFSQYFISLLARFSGPLILNDGGSMALRCVMVILSSSQADSTGKRNWNGKVLTPFCREKPLGDTWISGGGNKVWQTCKSYARSALSGAGIYAAGRALCLSEACSVPSRGLIAVAMTLLKRTPTAMILGTIPEPVRKSSAGNHT